jgi:hypothetical protein
MFNGIPNNGTGPVSGGTPRINLNAPADIASVNTAFNISGPNKALEIEQVGVPQFANLGKPPAPGSFTFNSSSGPITLDPSSLNATTRGFLGQLANQDF